MKSSHLEKPSQSSSSFPKPFLLGITGSMGSGKSTVTKLLANYIPTNDCDAINARLLEKGEEGYLALQNANLLFTQKNGQIDRKAMADAMFENPSVRKKIEAILHPLILKKMRQWASQQEDLCAVEVPLLFELGLQEEFDAIWTVVCSDQTALKRLEKERHISNQEAKRRLALQYSPQKKAALSHCVIYNDEDLETLKAQVKKCLETLEVKA